MRALEAPLFYLIFALRRLFGASEENDAGEVRAQAMLAWAESFLALGVASLLGGRLLQDSTVHPYLIGLIAVVPFFAFNHFYLSTDKEKWRAYRDTFRSLSALHRRCLDLASGLFIVGAILFPVFV